MYRFCIWWYWALAAVFVGRDATTDRKSEVSHALESGRWSGPETYDFWYLIGQAWLSIAAGIGFVTGAFLVTFRPDERVFNIAILGPATLFGFAIGGCVAIAPAIYASWYRRGGARPLKPAPGSQGWWMLAVQIPSALLLAITVR